MLDYISLFSTSNPQNKSPFIDFSTRFYWDRIGSSQSINTTNGELYCFQSIEGFGLSQLYHVCTNIMEYKTNNNNPNELLFEFTESQNNTIYFTTDTSIQSVTDIVAMIETNKQNEYSTYEKYGQYAETKRGIQAGLMWNHIYNPEESGPFNPVARTWSYSPNDFAMVIFDWDNIFASYQLSLDALDLAISNFIQVIKSKTVHGFVPNYKWVTNGDLKNSEDRTEPVCCVYYVMFVLLCMVSIDLM